MPDLFGSIFSAETGETILVRSFLLCVGAALVTGLMYFGAYSFKNRASGSFRTALIMLPAEEATGRPQQPTVAEPLPRHGRRRRQCRKPLI